MGVCLCHLLKTMRLRLQVKHPSEGAAAPPAMSFRDKLDNCAPSTYTQTRMLHRPAKQDLYIRAGVFFCIGM